MKYYIYLLQI